MRGRDPHENHRAATPLELLFDLTFVVAFGEAGNQLAHQLAEGHVRSGVISFCFVTFGICWAWIQFSWFASAYDTDDWAFRLLTMLTMCGVIVFALGLPELFESIDEGQAVNNHVIVAGYVIMRVAMIGQWLRAMRADEARRRCIKLYIVTLAVSQTIWVLLTSVETSVGQFFALITIPLAVELLGPIIAETRLGGTPWHAHHVAERYGLLVIITLGEGVIGTVAAMSALVHGSSGWSVDAALVLAAGIGLTFGLWWTYFAIPFGSILHLRRTASHLFGYGHMLIFGGIAATGSGLHVAALYLDHHSELSTLGTVLSVLIPVSIYSLSLYLMYGAVTRSADPFHVLLIAGTIGVLALTVVLASSGASLPVCLLVLALMPVVTIVGYETLGHRHMLDHLERLRS